MSGTWPMVLVDLVGVVLLASTAKLFADQFDGASRWWVFIATTAAMVFVLVAVPLRVLLMQQRAESDAAAAALRAQHDRQDFEARVGRGLDMADSEHMALQIAVGALTRVADDLQASIMLADNSDAHLQSVGSTPGCSASSVCDVATPHGCPAVRNGHPLEFADADNVDTCPHLAERGDPHLAAICVPVSVVGRATGVVHAVRSGLPFTAVERERISTIARQSGQRVGLLRATALAQLQASTDPLTGLFNRRSMENAVRVLMKEQIPFAVAICDLDHFKLLNDTYGHDTGDRALRLFSRTLRNTVRAADLVSRHGGEEFVVVMPHSDAVQAAAVLDRVRLELLSSLSDGRTPPFTVSAGLADTTETLDYDGLLTLADERLMLAKRNGRDRVVTRADVLPVA